MKKRSIWLLLFLLLIFAVALGVMRSRTAQVGPQVVPYVNPRIVSFTATPGVITAGQSVTLAWETTGAALISIRPHSEFHPENPGDAKVALPPWGTLTVEPKENTIYVLECEGPQGETAASASASVRVR